MIANSPASPTAVSKAPPAIPAVIAMLTNTPVPSTDPSPIIIEPPSPNSRENFKSESKTAPKYQRQQLHRRIFSSV